MTPLAVDPVVLAVVRAALSALFLAAVVHKLHDVPQFAATLQQYDLLPGLWIVPATRGLITAELCIAAGLWVPDVAPVAALAAASLLLLYAAAIGINLVRGRRDIDCGCGGPAGRQPLSAALVVRNVVLASVAAVGGLPAVARPTTWVDTVTIAAGAVALALLYAAIDQLVASAATSTIAVRTSESSKVQRVAHA